MTTWSALTWTTARAGGFTAYVLLTLSVLLGLALSLRWQRPNWPRMLTNEVHSYLTLLSLVFIGVHTTAVLVDPYIKFGLQDVLVPLATHYRTVWIALGIVSTYLALAIWLSSQIRPLIGFALWRKLHFATFLVYALSTVHGIGTGSDTRTLWGIAIYGLSVLAVGTLLTLRFLQPSKKAAEGHPLMAAITVFSMAVGALWTANGPLRAGWAAANNGTPVTTSTTSQSTIPTTQTTVPNPSQPSTGGGQLPYDGGGDGWHRDRHYNDGSGSYSDGSGGSQYNNGDD